MQPNVSQIIECNIHDLGLHGEGIGAINNFTVFIQGALPKEFVRAKVTQVKKKYAIATLISVLKQSKDRINPKCPYFEKCGGCQIMHLSYDGQLFYKKKRIEDAFLRIAKLKLEKEVIMHKSPDEFAYRNKIQLPATKEQGVLKLGLYARGSHDIIPHDKCLIHSKLGEKIYTRVLQALEKSSLTPYDEKSMKGELRHVLIRTAVFNKEALITFITTKAPSCELKAVAKKIFDDLDEVKGIMHHKNAKATNAVFDRDFTNLFGRDHIFENLSNLSFKLSSASFFQVNSFQAEKLYKRAIELSGLTKNDTALDAYCGIGTLTLLAAIKARHVTGIEVVPSAIDDAKGNMERNKISNVSFVCAKVEDKIHEMGALDVVFLNPPRKGCDKHVIATINKKRPKTLIYVSCDPATLARDTKLLIEGGYKLDMLEGFDMFPQTMHVETLAKFTLELP
ncbi:23S rRNA (uracil(1939)-C(5))-methyltransferase RlmD [Candidatus Aerophobetes bacterium]|uniref:23S rRNA (Uracil(1939)-C(5))-methyltransferase RlmD n=1 Tax=Aerophobetes bacterium TaxID=2030807 RepID=A0A2A4YM07_UNCAE|nr:MAG: 23S rRNA (uracil(1939)-C(5))-methyltransferase RlmD [Candidatus Aerophobetes bacterium]